jgi:hypothetical protein
MNGAEHSYGTFIPTKHHSAKGGSESKHHWPRESFTYVIA